MWPEVTRLNILFLDKQITKFYAKWYLSLWGFNKEDTCLITKFFENLIGCACFPLISKGLRNKFEPTTHKCVFFGYSNQHKKYMCFNHKDGKVTISRNVKFNEEEFPFLNLEKNNKQEIKQNKSSTKIPIILLAMIHISSRVT